VRDHSTNAYLLPYSGFVPISSYDFVEPVSYPYFKSNHFSEMPIFTKSPSFLVQIPCFIVLVPMLLQIGLERRETSKLFSMNEAI
jgi:hypothetical protein